MYILVMINVMFGFLFLSGIKYIIFCAMSKTKYSLRYFVLFLVVILVTTHSLSILGHTVQVLYLVLLGVLPNRQTQSFHLICFYGLYAILTVSALGTILQSFGELFLPSHFFVDDVVTLYDSIATPILIGIIQFGVIKLIAPNLEIIRKNQHLQKSNRLKFINSLLSTSLILYLLTYQFNNASYKNAVNMFFVVSLISLLVYLKNTTQNYFNFQLAQQKQQQLDHLTTYTTQIEDLYKSINGFRHDYANLIVSLETSIQAGDINQIRSIYEDVLKNSSSVLNHGNHTLGSLTKIDIPAIKSILSNKIILALEKGIHIEFEIEQKWSTCHVDVFDYIRMLGILLDNAIEASEACSIAFINIAFITDNVKQEHRLIIENSTNQEFINISHIFQDGVTSKGANRGIGLSNMQHILSNYEQAHIETECSNYRFRQTLITQG
ncbi:sensory histidine kinase DcuS [Leuconostoc suionicum]|uniref:Sensory histidine kinase DcuS n=2 Tax=Leuconostoc suionicum TaxID=1511761 RepID=A0A2N9KGS5_9LACO|nr:MULTISPECIES: GHKL domain-containing protein [Leuconostoc]MBE4727511.1 GHKL domain-containing protein [Leuconostoc suionicum]MCT4403309.1 GHKL domain-containing protein [Leuconostoc suionicum]MDI6523311.1 GHKL domain-containing protein [Leuconostoc suionicum]MDI6551667.1 GHKL domain-containing protein [Leuconostoc suionicum]SPD94927.1 sensory histidine kinase DcuS [Leuconostoc suionicum]